MIPASLTLAFALVFAPFIVFCLGFLQIGPGAVAAVLALAAAVPVFRRTDWRGKPDMRALGGAFAVAAALTLLSGIGHVFFQADDWMVRDAILFDLVRNPWPVGYALDGATSVMRTPLGMYLVPALAGKAFGINASQIAMFIQNTALLALCLYIFMRSAPPGRSRAITLGLFVAFSGLDCIPWLRRQMDGLPGLSLPHIEPWSGFFQYSSNVTEVFWTPHHGLAGWAAAAGYLVWREGRISALGLAPLWAASVFWSPLAALGAVPFLAFAFICDIRDGKVRLADFAAAVAVGVAALPVAVYLGRDTGVIEKGFLDIADPDIARSYVALIALEVAPLLAIAWRGRDPEDRLGLIEFVLIAATLVAIPLYTLGFANDFAMRVSIPALTLLCVRCVPGLASLGGEPPLRRAIILGIVGLGAVTPAVEIYRNVVTPSSPASACNVVESLRDGPYAGSPVQYYVAAQESFRPFARLFREAQGAPLPYKIKACWPGRRFVYMPTPTGK